MISCALERLKCAFLGWMRVTISVWPSASAESAVIHSHPSDAANAQLSSGSNRTRRSLLGWIADEIAAGSRCPSALEQASLFSAGVLLVSVRLSRLVLTRSLRCSQLAGLGCHRELLGCSRSLIKQQVCQQMIFLRLEVLINRQHSWSWSEYLSQGAAWFADRNLSQ